jgi:hypothetical protein
MRKEHSTIPSSAEAPSDVAQWEVPCGRSAARIAVAPDVARRFPHG